MKTQGVSHCHFKIVILVSKVKVIYFAFETYEL